MKKKDHSLYACQASIPRAKTALIYCIKAHFEKEMMNSCYFCYVSGRNWTQLLNNLFHRHSQRMRASELMELRLLVLFLALFTL